MEQLTYSYIDNLLMEHALQLEKSKVSPRWHITEKGKFGYGPIYGYLEYHNPTDLAKGAQLYHGRNYQLLATLMTILEIPFNSKESNCY